MYQDEELHDELLKAFRQYFEANQRWINEGTKRAAMDLRYWMSEIRRICSARRVEVQKWRKWKDVDMAEKKAKKKAQNQEGKNDTTAN
jgi:hypothetical protein